MVKACKTFEVNVTSLEHELLDMILRMECTRSEDMKKYNYDVLTNCLTLSLTYIHRLHNPKLLGLFTFGAAPVSTRHGCGCGIRVRFGQPILGTLTKIDGESLDSFNDFYNQYKS
uniref:Putative ovule protein n=1 Tax=Solanum chacoense TaxID=4108 RepID=A0A0V0HCZ4_SOLCH